MIRLGVNIDHVATLRNVRGTLYPSPIEAGLVAQAAGAANITCHLREDRRHIKDQDVIEFKKVLNIPLNLEIAATHEMFEFAKKIKPHAVTLVPEKRQELTTEGGLDLANENSLLGKYIAEFKRLNIKTCLFIESTINDIRESKLLGADAVEMHTGGFCNAIVGLSSYCDVLPFLEEFIESANEANHLKMGVHIGHGLNYENAMWAQKIPYCEEANIGHAIVARSVFVGFERAVREMNLLLNDKNKCPSF